MELLRARSELATTRQRLGSALAQPALQVQAVEGSTLALPAAHGRHHHALRPRTPRTAPLNLDLQLHDALETLPMHQLLRGVSCLLAVWRFRARAPALAPCTAPRRSSRVPLRRSPA